MAQILVRCLDDALVARLKERARCNHRSLQGEVKAILEEAAPMATKAEALAIVDRWQRYWEEKGKTFSDSAELIREDQRLAVSRIVLDASVAVKWVLREEHAATARRILSTRELVAPHLLWAEVGNALWKRYRRSESSVEEVRRMLGDVQQLPVMTFAHWPLLPAAFDLAISLDQTVYDCFYLALADARDSVMVTADRRFHDVVSRSVWADRIVWIGDVT